MENNVREIEDHKIACEFIKLQYIQLSDSIKNTRERIHQITLAVTWGLPASLIVAKALDIDSPKPAVGVVVIIMPAVLFAFFLFYIAERQAIRRYGLYLNNNIDPLMRMGQLPDFAGWHTITSMEYARYKEKDRGKILLDRSLDSNIVLQTIDYDDARTIGFATILTCYGLVSVAASSFTISTYICQISQCNDHLSEIFISILLLEIVLIGLVFILRRNICNVIDKYRKYFRY